mmetsp:Transcript_5350/g.12783  ORF Transcript_5350/g.12783 Transcript_5350/m.12783 type:complete len:231 (-) Transcript_5350:64-756(-)
MGEASEHHPSVLRNRGPIRDQLLTMLPSTPFQALEVASGSAGQLEVFAEAFPHGTWQPSEYIPPQAKEGPGADLQTQVMTETYGSDALTRIDRLGGSQKFKNVLPAIALDASLPFEQWPVADKAGWYDLVYASNVFHISDWAVGQGLLLGAARCLKPGGLFVTYGAFKMGGDFGTQSNADFDANLRQRNPTWGVRDVDHLKEVAAPAGLELVDRRDMPANNHLLQFVKKG